MALLPTPLEYCARLSEHLGITLLLKRDDLTGLAFGGNKTRNLEFRLPEPIQAGCDTLALVVQSTSNSARQTTAAANKLGLRTALFLRGKARAAQGNLLIDQLLGAEIHWVQDDDGVTADAAQAYVRTQADQGRSVFLLNDSPMFGIASAAAYIECWLEIRRQLAAIQKTADFVYMSSGSKGQAGLELAHRALQDPVRVVGVAFNEPGRDRRPMIAALARAAAERLSLDITVGVGDIENDNTQAGPGYGVPTPECIEAIRVCALLEGLLLDPVYTGKAMAALFAAVRSGRIPRGATVVFIHTGGQPALFATADLWAAEKSGSRLGVA